MTNQLTCQVDPRVDIIRNAMQRVPVTEEGLPVGFYRLDLIPPNVQSLSKVELLEVLNNAYVDLDFSNTYPTFNEGLPFWHRLDFEPGLAYGAFEMYLDADNSVGPRQLHEIADSEVFRNLATKMLRMEAASAQASAEPTPTAPTAPTSPTSSATTSQATASTATSQASAQDNTAQQATQDQLIALLNKFSILYMWRARARAFDLYREAAYRHTKLRRQVSTEDKHYKMATELLSRLQSEILYTDNFFKSMANSPKEAINLLKALVTIQRISVGLPANGPLPTKEMPNETSFEMLMRTVSKMAATQNLSKIGVNGGVNGFGGNGEANSLTQALNDPTTANMLQEVIIRISGASRTSNDNDVNNSKKFTGRHNVETVETSESVLIDHKSGEMTVTDNMTYADNNTLDEFLGN